MSLGIIESKFPDVDLPKTDIWSFLYPSLIRWKDRPYMECCETGKIYTYKDITDASLRWGKELLRHFHDENPPVVAIICPNVMEYPILYLGCFAVGCPVVPIRHCYSPELVLYFLLETRASVLVVDDSVIQDFQEIIRKLGNKFKVYVRNSNEKSFEGATKLMPILFSQDEGLTVDETIKLNVRPESTAMICFSSGTTGKPKGIVLSHKASLFNKKKTQDIETDTLQETVIGNLAYAHVALVHFYFIGGIIYGRRIVNIDPSCSLNHLLDVIERFKPTSLILRGYHVEKLNCFEEEQLKKLKSVKILSNIGIPKNAHAIEKLWMKLGRKILVNDLYGATEVGGIAGTPTGTDDLSVTGKLAPGLKGRFLHVDTGEPILEPYKYGEFYVKTPGVMDGYLNNPDATARVIDKNGWYRTGDVGFYDENNFVTIIDRVKDIVENKGQKIYPSEVENVLLSHHAIQDAGVVGMVDPKSNEEVAKAYVVRKEPVEEKDILSFVEENTSPAVDLLGGVAFVESLPRNQMGKLMRKYIREMAWNSSQKLNL